MTHAVLAGRPSPPRIRDIFAKLFHRHERQLLLGAESDLAKLTIERLTSRHDQLHSLFRFDEHEPPKEGRFDAWGRNWNPRTDTFQWERFPGVYMEPEGSFIGAKLKLGNLPDYATGYRIEWWATVPTPPPFPDDSLIYVEASK